MKLSVVNIIMGFIVIKTGFKSAIVIKPRKVILILLFLFFYIRKPFYIYLNLL